MAGRKGRMTYSTIIASCAAPAVKASPGDGGFVRRDGIHAGTAGDMSFGDSDALSVAARAGYGLAHVDHAIAAGALVPVLAKFIPSPSPVSLVYPQTRHLSRKVRAFVDS